MAFEEKKGHLLTCKGPHFFGTFDIGWQIRVARVATILNVSRVCTGSGIAFVPTLGRHLDGPKDKAANGQVDSIDDQQGQPAPEGLHDGLTCSLLDLPGGIQIRNSVELCWKIFVHSALKVTRETLRPD